MLQRMKMLRPLGVVTTVADGTKDGPVSPLQFHVALATTSPNLCEEKQQ